MISSPAMLPALLLALVVCFQQAKLEDTEEMPSTAVPELMGGNYSYEVNEGSVFRLVCRYKDLGSEVAVLWRKNQSYISLGSHVMATGNIAHRLAILDDQSLQVNNASRADAGDYTCVLGVKDQKLEQQHTLRVKYPPKITNLEPRDGVSTQMGTDVTLKCESDGFPKPKITWTLQEKNITHAEVQDEGRTLYIPKIQPNHAGQYKCISDNGIHNPDEESISVSVLFPPQVSIDPNEKDIPVLLDNSVTLKCKVVQANPKPTIKWLFNGTLMPDRTTEEMTIPKMKLSDAGVYKCKVGNSLGQTFENSFTLSVIYNEQQEMEPSNGQQEMEGDSSKGTTNSQLQFPVLLTVIVMFSSVFW